MSKTIYLLDTKGDFIVFGVGMFLLDNADNTVKVGVLAGKDLAGWNLSEHATPQESKGARAAWIQAIIAAPDGSLLKWDAEKGYPVDELAEDAGAFAPMPETVFLPDYLKASDRLDTQSGPIALEPVAAPVHPSPQQSLRGAS